MAEPLFAEFEKPSHDEWLEAARLSLRGRPLDSLVAQTYEDIEIHPLIGAGDVGCAHLDTLPGQYPFRRGSMVDGYRERPWLIAQEIDIAEPAAFNSALRHALANGQTAIVLSNRPNLESSADLQAALAGVDLRRFPLFIRCDERAPALYQLLQAALAHDDLARIQGCVGYDPLANLARTGAMPADARELMAAHVEKVAEHSPHLGSILVSAAVYHDAGANAVQELALALATGVEYLRALSERGIDLQLAASKFHVELDIGENFFMELAKFRALKSLWAQVMRAFAVGEAGQRIRLHARSGRRHKTRSDRYLNLLRLTTEALAAALGGVDSLTLSPFDAPLGQSDDFSRRLSRNLQLILQDEMDLTQLIDPAGGAWHVERLTDELAQRAWKQFQRIEAEGGMLAALQAGMIQADVAAVAAKRRTDLLSGESVLVGVNRYVEDAESLRQIPPAQTAAAVVVEGGIRAAPLKPLRLEEANASGSNK